MIEELVERGFAYESDGDVYFRVARFPEYGRLSGQRPDQVAEQEPNPRKEDPRDFALWKANKPGEDTWWDSPWGRGRPGWHIECSAMSEKYLGTEFEIHGGGLDLVFPHHENEIAQSQSLGHAFARSGCTTGCSVSAARRCTSPRQRHLAEDRARPWGRETLLVFYLTGHWRKPLDYSEETLEAARRAPKASATSSAVRPTRAGGAWERFAAALDDDFNTPTRSRSCTGGATTSCSAVHSRSSASRRLPRTERAPPEVVELAERRIEARSAATSRRPTAFATRSRPPAGRCATRPAASGSSAADEGDARARLRAKRRARALRGRRRVLEVWATERASSQSPWLDAGPRPQVKPERELSEAAGTRDHQGVVAWCEPYPVRGRVGARRGGGRRCSSASTRSPTRATSAPCAERRGCGRDRRRRSRARLGTRHGCGLPGVGRGGRARSDGGRAESRALPRGREARRSLGLRRRIPRATPRCGRST